MKLVKLFGNMNEVNCEEFLEVDENLLLEIIEDENLEEKEEGVYLNEDDCIIYVGEIIDIIKKIKNDFEDVEGLEEVLEILV